MPALSYRRLIPLLALAGAVALPRPGGAQQPADFGSMPLAEITRWLEENLPTAAAFRYVRIDDDDDGARRVEASLQIAAVKFTGCSMDFRERLTIDNKKAEVRRWSLNLGRLTRDVVAEETPAADGQLAPSRSWTLVIRDVNGRASLRAVGEEGTPTPGRLEVATILIADEAMARRVAGALSAAAASCRG